MHRLARGQEPDLDRGVLRTAVAMVRRNGRVSFAPRRGLKMSRRILEVLARLDARLSTPPAAVPAALSRRKKP